MARGRAAGPARPPLDKVTAAAMIDRVQIHLDTDLGGDPAPQNATLISDTPARR